MNDFAYLPQLYQELRDSYRRDARRRFKAVQAEPESPSASPGLGSRFAAAWQAFLAHDASMPARGGQSA